MTQQLLGGGIHADDSHEGSEVLGALGIGLERGVLSIDQEGLQEVLDPKDASWVASEDYEDMPPAVFPTAEAAYRAWELAERVTKERSRRRKKALNQLGRSVE